MLIQAIKMAEIQRRVGVNGDLSMAIRAWKSLVIDPIRRREVDPLTYSRFYPTVSGETVELVVIRASLVQKYLIEDNSPGNLAGETS